MILLSLFVTLYTLKTLKIENNIAWLYISAKQVKYFKFIESIIL
jgi:hypothetical protein